MSSIRYNIEGAQFIEDPRQENGYKLTFPLGWKDRQMLSATTADATRGSGYMDSLLHPFDFNQVAKCDIFWVQTYYRKKYASNVNSWEKDFATVDDKGVDIDTAKFGDLAVILYDAQGKHICTFLLEEPDDRYLSMFGDPKTIFVPRGRGLRSQLNPRDFGDTPDDDEALVGLFAQDASSEHLYLLYHAFVEDYE